MNILTGDHMLVPSTLTSPNTTLTFVLFYQSATASRRPVISVILHRNV